MRDYIPQIGEATTGTCREAIEEEPHHFPDATAPKVFATGRTFLGAKPGIRATASAGTTSARRNADTQKNTHAYDPTANSQSSNVAWTRPHSTIMANGTE